MKYNHHWECKIHDLTGLSVCLTNYCDIKDAVIYHSFNVAEKYTSDLPNYFADISWSLSGLQYHLHALYKLIKEEWCDSSIESMKMFEGQLSNEELFAVALHLSHEMRYLVTDFGVNLDSLQGGIESLFTLVLAFKGPNSNSVSLQYAHIIIHTIVDGCQAIKGQVWDF